MKDLTSIVKLPPLCRLPTWDEYLSQTTAYMGKDNATFNKIGLITSRDDQICTPIQFSPTQYSLVPGPEFSPRLYRGQHSDYGSCKAGLYRRNLSLGERLYWVIKQNDLLQLLGHHPAMTYMLHGCHVGNLKPVVSLNIIAQHYGFKTDIIDLTRSERVAMFFATHKYEDGMWSAAIGHNAVLYSVDMPTLIKQQQGLFPIGIHPLPRPHAQRAFGLQLGNQQDLINLPGVTAKNFTVTKKIADDTLSDIGGINSIFPHDPFEALIDELLSRRQVHLEAVVQAYVCKCLPHNLSYSELEGCLNNAGFSISTSPIARPDQSLIDEAQNTALRLRQTYGEHVKIRVVGDHINMGRSAN